MRPACLFRIYRVLEFICIQVVPNPYPSFSFPNVWVIQQQVLSVIYSIVCDVQYDAQHTYDYSIKSNLGTPIKNKLEFSTF